MSRGTSGNAGAVSLHAEDLVNDRELAAVEDDLAHEGIVHQIAALVASVKHPRTSRSTGHTKRFATAGFVDNSCVAEAVVSTLQDTLAQSLSPVDRDDAMYQYVAVNRATALAARSDSISDEQLDGILREAATSPWLDDLGHIELPLTLAPETGRAAAAIEGLPTAQAVADIVHNYAGVATHAATL